MGPERINPADAEQRGYVLTPAECARRLALRERLVRRELLSAGPGDVHYLPHVMVLAGGHASCGYRVSEEDVDTARIRLGLPGDPIREREALEILAGRRLSGGARPYGRYRHRLLAAVRDDLVKRYVAFGQPRYSRNEVETLARVDKESGVSARGMSHKTRSARLHARARRDGLIDLAETALITGLTEGAIRQGDKERFGGRKIAGQWFFERTLVEHYKRRARPQPAVERPCAGAGCRRTVTRSAAKVAAAEARAVTRGRRTPLFFCSECRDRNRKLVKKKGGPVRQRPRSETHRRKIGEHTAARHEAGDFGTRAEQSARFSQVRKTVSRSPKLRVKRANNWIVSRYGRPLTDEERVRIETAARSERARLNSTRILETKLRELWETEKTQMEIANELYVTPGRISQLATALGLPARRRGRRPANV